MCNYIKKNNRYCKNYSTQDYCHLHNSNCEYKFLNNVLQLTASLLLVYFVLLCD